MIGNHSISENNNNTYELSQTKKEPAHMNELAQKKGKGGVSEKLISNFMLSNRIPAFKDDKPSFYFFYKFSSYYFFSII